MMGIGADRFLKVSPELQSFYLHWEPESTPELASQVGSGEDGVRFKAKGTPYEFRSKSGGSILQEVLFARFIMAEVFSAHDVVQEICILIPRNNSVLVIADKQGSKLKAKFDSLKSAYPMLELSEGERLV